MKLAATLLLAVAVALPATAAPVSLDPIFAGYSQATPGCAVGVKAKGAAPVFSVYGSADLEHAVPITPDTVFEAGSVSKQFTAAAILLLADAGKLALSDDIRTYLPEMPDYGRPITIDMLLSHTSGLRDWGEVMDLAGWPRTSRVYTPAEVLQITARQRALNYPPGEAYSYTNTGYNLAAAIVQRVSGQTLADFTRDRIFRPLGMTRTAWRDDFRRVVPGRAVAYSAVGGGFAQDMPFENTYGHGGLLTTVGDLLIWNDALSAGQLSPSLDARMRQQAVLTDGRTIAYARGLVVQDAAGRAEVAHSGSTAGYRAWLARLPASGLSVALLCNRGDASPVVLGRRVADAWLATPALPPAAAPPPEDLARLPGLYVDDRAGGLLRIRAEDGALRLAGVVLRPVTAGHYRNGDADLTFGPAGAVRRTPDGDVTTYRRVTAVTPAAAELAALAGAYASDEAGATLVVSIADGRLAIAPADRPSAVEFAEPLDHDAFLLSGDLVRVQRDRRGRPEALRFTNGRVYSMVFKRASGP